MNMVVPIRASLELPWCFVGGEKGLAHRLAVLRAILLAAVLLSHLPAMAGDEELGVIGESRENGFPVVWKFVDELPGEGVRSKFPWLIVIGWSYDGSSRNGMPAAADNAAMIRLETAIEESLQAKGWCTHAYSRTGNSLKELVYYIGDRDRFMQAFNDALRKHPRYPIEIRFYEDPKWEDFSKMRERFRKKGNSS